MISHIVGRRVSNRSSSIPRNDEKNETTMEDLCSQMKKMQLMIAKLEKKPVPTRPVREPYCSNCKKTVHYAAQCTDRRNDRLVCTYSGKHGQSEQSFYTKKLMRLLESVTKVGHPVTSRF